MMPLLQSSALLALMSCKTVAPWRIIVGLGLAHRRRSVSDVDGWEMSPRLPNYPATWV